VLQVRRTDEGDIEIALLVDAEPPHEGQRLLVHQGDVATLIDMLRPHLEDDDPEDRSTLRNLRPVT
jgi:hypothetical protein